MDLKELYEMIPKGKKNATRKLHLIWNVTEREVRKIIEQMICKEHWPVCNLGKGHFRPETLDEFTAFENLNRKFKKQYERKDYHIREIKKGFCNTKMIV